MIVRAQQPAFNPLPYQKKIKCCSKLLRFLSYVCIISGGFAVFGNVLYIFMAGKFSKMSWKDVDEQQMMIKISTCTLVAMSILKIISAILLIA